jgi:hypothetical protein
LGALARVAQTFRLHPTGGPPLLGHRHAAATALSSKNRVCSSSVAPAQASRSKDFPSAVAVRALIGRGARGPRSKRWAASAGRRVAALRKPRARGSARRFLGHRSPRPIRARTAIKDRRRPTLPGGCPPSTIGAEWLNCSVRNGKRCFPLAMRHRNFARRDARWSLKTAQGRKVFNKYPSSPRPISTGRLRTLLRFHRRPINLVVYQGSYSLKGMGELISRTASRLDAFSGYPFRA